MPPLWRARALLAAFDKREAYALLGAEAMRLLGLLFPFLSLSSTACLGSTVIGEGPLDEDAIPLQRDEDVRRNLSAISSTGPLFECSHGGGHWPAATDGSRLSITRSGQYLSVGGRSLRIDRVDKSGPFSSYVFYYVTSGDERLSIEGSVSAGSARPTYLTRRSGTTNESFSCASTGGSNAGVFDDAQLDVLVTLTNGRR